MLPEDKSLMLRIINEWEANGNNQDISAKEVAHLKKRLTYGFGEDIPYDNPNHLYGSVSYPNWEERHAAQNRQRFGW